MKTSWLGFFLIILLTLFIISSFGLWVTNHKDIPFYGIGAGIVCLNSFLTIVMLLTRTSRWLSVLILVLIILLSLVVFALSKISGLACIDAGERCVKQIEDMNRPLLIMLAAIPVIALFEKKAKNSF